MWLRSRLILSITYHITFLLSSPGDFALIKETQWLAKSSNVFFPGNPTGVTSVHTVHTCCRPAQRFPHRSSGAPLCSTYQTGGSGSPFAGPAHNEACSAGSAVALSLLLSSVMQFQTLPRQAPLKTLAAGLVKIHCNCNTYFPKNPVLCCSSVSSFLKTEAMISISYHLRVFQSQTSLFKGRIVFISFSQAIIKEAFLEWESSRLTTGQVSDDSDTSATYYYPLKFKSLKGSQTTFKMGFTVR